MPFTARFWDKPGAATRLDGRSAVKRALDRDRGLLWVDMVRPDSADEEMLKADFGLHLLTIDACVGTEAHFPRVNEYEDYSAIILHGIDYAGDEVADTAELVLIIGRTYVISSRRSDFVNVSSLAELADEDGSPMSRGPQFLAYALVDSLIEHMIPAIQQMDSFADELEDSLIHSPRKESLDAVMRLKRSASSLGRVLRIQEDVVGRISRSSSGHLGEAQVYFRDAHDRLLLAEDLTEGVRERAQDAMGTYLSAVANGQNESMKVLAIIATAFLPMGILVGAFGMNFDEMPGVDWRYGFHAVVIAMVGVLALVVSVFWLRTWLIWTHHRVAGTLQVKVPEARLSSYAANLRHWVVDIPVMGGKTSARKAIAPISFGRRLNLFPRKQTRE